MALGAGGRYQGFCGDTTEALLLQSVTMRGVDVKNLLMSFMDDLL